MDIKSKSMALSTSRPDTTSTGQPEVLTDTPEHVINKTTLIWTAPTTNNDGTPLKDLYGYKIYYGQTKNSLGNKERNQMPVSRTESRIVIYNLASGEWCFEVTVLNTSGKESDFSDGICINIQ